MTETEDEIAVWSFKLVDGEKAGRREGETVVVVREHPRANVSGDVWELNRGEVRDLRDNLDVYLGDKP